MPTADEWMNDMPQQFLGKKKIRSLVEAFARQLDELQQTFEDMGSLLDIDTASGKNLDYVGTIVPLDRKEAGELAEIGDEQRKILDDALYRQILKYKLLRNTSDGTYYDIIQGLEYLYDFQFLYREEARFPATIILSMPLELDGPDLLFRRHLCIRPGGIGIVGEKRFAAFYAVPVRYENRVTLIGSFYPRPILFLNGEMRLDGEYLMDGFFGSPYADLYPVRLAVHGDIRQEILHSARYRQRTNLRAPIYQDMHFGVCGTASQQSGSENRVRIAGSAKETVSSGEKLMIEKDLWFLDGSLQMDGTVCMDADIYEEQL